MIRLGNDSNALIYNDTHPKQKFITLLNIRSIWKHTSDFLQIIDLINLQ